MQAIVNTVYPNRIQLSLGALTGPFSITNPDSTVTSFDPRELLEVYVGGLPVTLISFSFDAVNNRYLLFTAKPMDTTQVVQVIYHMPSPAYASGAGTLPGFALVASVSTTPDPISPSVGLAVPANAVINTTIPFIWNAASVAQIRITTSTGYDSGLRSSVASAGVVYATGFTSSGNFTATIAAFDAGGNPILVNGTALSATIPLVVASS